MSMSLVRFLNIKNIEVHLDKYCKISVEYVVDKGVNVSPNDWIAIYPNGVNVWDSVNLDLMVAYEFVLNGPISKVERRYKLEFSLAGAKNLKYKQKYQFVYISRASEIYGISNTFEFHPPALYVVSDNSNASQESDDTSTGKENIEDRIARDNNKKRKAKRRTQQLSLRPKVESDKSESDDLGGSGDQNTREAKNFINKFKKNKQVFMNKQVETCPNNNICAVHRMSPPISCSNCHRVAGLLRAQEELYTKIKNLAEINSDLRSQVGHLQQQVELSQAACQKLSVTLMRERQAKQFYQAAAYNQAEYEYQIMVVEPFVPNVYVPTSREPRIPSRNRTEEKARGWSVLKLKAIIGNQEEKIQNLTKEIAQLKMERMQRVAVVVRDFEVNKSEEPLAKESIKDEAPSSSDEN